MKVEVVYLCWGCGGSLAVIEERDIYPPVPQLTIWNICEECKKKHG